MTHPYGRSNQILHLPKKDIVIIIYPFAKQTVELMAGNLFK